MELGQKLAHLRTLEGHMRGLGRALSKAEVARLMHAELGVGLSPAYLSQIERGSRRHLTASTRARLARFFKVHPGYLVEDPAGYETTIRTAALQTRGDLGGWLAARADELRDDPLLFHLFLRLARSPAPREALLLLDRLLDDSGEPAAQPVAAGHP